MVMQAAKLVLSEGNGPQGSWAAAVHVGSETVRQDFAPRSVGDPRPLALPLSLGELLLWNKTDL